MKNKLDEKDCMSLIIEACKSIMVDGKPMTCTIGWPLTFTYDGKSVDVFEKDIDFTAKNPLSEVCSIVNSAFGL